ncbi:hypothetical protein LG943_20845 [Streptomonospora sp. S1-112]|uniref:Ribosomal protein L7/L12 C-terminal domain-containing protein n=1 Tax=Streptomonospora mangrovi TaxID=2883123 RepID=A0A9X3NRI9_9ACTN|nr:hypothetical protein [Streptomonospora mangrovi]MDA0566739.1 hypothetical protein [Streptomonospora mangrovi]
MSLGTSEFIVLAVVVVVAVLVAASAVTARRRGAARPPVRPAAPLLQPLPRDLVERATALIRQNKQIPAIKLIREETGYDLRSAKEVSDALAQGRTIPTLPEPGAGPVPASASVGGSLAERARDLRDQDRVADAVRLVAGETGMSEAEATRFVTGLD